MAPNRNRNYISGSGLSLSLSLGGLLAHTREASSEIVNPGGRTPVNQKKPPHVISRDGCTRRDAPPSFAAVFGVTHLSSDPRKSWSLLGECEAQKVYDAVHGSGTIKTNGFRTRDLRICILQEQQREKLLE